MPSPTAKCRKYTNGVMVPSHSRGAVQYYVCNKACGYNTDPQRSR